MSTQLFGYNYCLFAMAFELIVDNKLVEKKISFEINPLYFE